MPQAAASVVYLPRRSLDSRGHRLVDGAGGAHEEALVEGAAVAAAANVIEHTLPALLCFVATPCALVAFLRRLPVCWHEP